VVEHGRHYPQSQVRGLQMTQPELLNHKAHRKIKIVNRNTFL